MEFRTIQQLAENARDLALDNSRAVILHDDPRFAGTVADLDTDLGEDAGFLAGIERIVDRFLHGGDQGLGRGIETEQMTILEEEFGDGDFALAARHFRSGGG